MTELPSYDFLMLQLKLKQIWQHRSLGQHFLTDQALLDRIAAAAGAGPETLAVEIGPGPGTLTTKLAERAGAVLAIELDPRMRPLHQDAFERADNVEFLYADALRVRLGIEARQVMERRGLTDTVLTGNLPFQITSPLLFGQCGPDIVWRRMAVMIQKEVANRITAGPNNKDYGILTVKLAYWWRVAERFEVSAEQFFPRPKVDATVLVFERAAQERSPSPEVWKGLSPFIDAAFGQRRKMLFNSLAGRWTGHVSKEATLEAMAATGIPEKARAENLTPEDFVRLFLKLTEESKK